MRNVSEEEQQIKRCLPLVKKIAGEMKRHGGILDYDDLVQEGMIAVWKASPHFCEGKGYQLSTFMHDVIRNRMLDAIEKYNKREPAKSLDEEMCVIDEETIFPEAEARRKLIFELLTKIVGRDDAEIIMKYHGMLFEKQTLKEIAEEKGVKYKDIRNRYTRALEKLRSMAEQSFELKNSLSAICAV